MKLFTFPYALGTSAIYADLARELSGYLQVENMNYPGHGARIGESLLYTVEELAADAMKLIKETDEDYALLGYSLGARVCCEIMRQLQESSHQKPKHVFLLASPPPSTRSNISQTDDITVEEARKILSKMGNTPKEFLECDNIMTFYLPIIQADVKALENYHYLKWPFKTIDSPITIINGQRDRAFLKEASWKSFLPINADVEFLRFAGKHFFLFEEKENLSLFKEVVLNKLR